MKTAMQELMDGFDDYQLESQNDSITIEKLKEVITKEFLSKEKEQIIEAVEETMREMILYESFRTLENGEQYYQETFGDNHKK